MSKDIIDVCPFLTILGSGVVQDASVGELAEHLTDGGNASILGR